MLFHLLKLYARIAIHLYCRKVVINKPEYLKAGGPLLLAANHPNSFLDGVILTTLFEKRIYSLARGDVFKDGWINSFLRWVGLLPVYRSSEGPENLEQNYTTFAACIEGFREKKIVLIFSEGRCENEWHLRPLRKGTARLANSSWDAGIPLKVLPVGINYSSFKRFGKDLHILFGEPFERPASEDVYGKKLLAFNQELNGQLERLVYEIDPADKNKINHYFSPSNPLLKEIVLFLPALVGAIIHLPLFLIVKGLTDAKFRESGHYDSVITCGLILLYPIYILVIALILFNFIPWLGFAIILIFPLTAWSYAQTRFIKN